MTRRHALLLAACTTWLLACEPSSPAEPLAAAPEPALAIVDGSSPDGLAGFYFLPPVVAGPPARGDQPFDATLLDLLAVEICAWDGVACVGSLVRRITAADGPPDGLRMDADGERYMALWKTKRDGLDPSNLYRVRVVAGGSELGHADVRVKDGAVGSGEEGVVVIRNGSTLPVAFRVEEGVGQRAGPGAAEVRLEDGKASLSLPEGALSGDVFITAQPADGLLPSGGQRWCRGRRGTSAPTGSCSTSR